MKIVNFELNGNQRLGAWVGTKVYDLNAGYELYVRQTSSADGAHRLRGRFPSLTDNTACLTASKARAIARAKCVSSTSDGSQRSAT